MKSEKVLHFAHNTSISQTFDDGDQVKEYYKIIRERFSVMYILLAVGITLAYIQNNFTASILEWPPQRNFDIVLYLHPLCVFACTTVHLLSRARKLTDTQCYWIGIMFQPIVTFCLGFSFFFRDIPAYASHTDITYVAVWIFVFPIIVPLRSSVTFTIGTISALIPVGAYLFWRGSLEGPWPSTAMFFEYFSPNFFCTVMSMVPGYLLYRMSVNQIREQQSLEKLGSYKLVKKLGAGGMGEVWQAEHMTLARPAAIKLILAKAGQDEATKTRALQRFKREAKATAKLNSPHTVRLFDYGINEDGTFYYVMELLHGMDLETLVKEFGVVPANRALYFLEQVCDSLAEAHSSGLVHRDIKPSNLYLCHLGLNYDFVKVFDFGLVSETKSDEQAKEDVKLTAEGKIIGTPAFLAPEMARGETIDPRADIYSLGCVAFWLLTGEYVFKATSPFQMVINHMSVPPDAPSSRTDQPIPKELDDLILQCLAKSPEHRPKDAEELRGRLRSILIDPWTEIEAAEWWSGNPAAQEAVDKTRDLAVRVETKSKRLRKIAAGDSKA
ncbi:MAG: serine/threonine-protein kinase [Planctomycetota bacterium]|nr:serine/threonine-protein kinase [Planctomycetota bacterium]